MRNAFLLTPLTILILGTGLITLDTVKEFKYNNNTERDSTASNNSYNLNVESFTVGDSSEIDLAEKENYRTVPISINLNNSRHGLKGINMQNISYSLKIGNSSNTNCNTGWIKASDMLKPGKSLSIETHEIAGDTEKDFSLESCGLNSVQEDREITLKLQYSYSTQSKFISELKAPTADQSLKQSRTAKTPVKAVLSTRTPINHTGDPSAYTELQLGFETTKPVKYRVDELEVSPDPINQDVCEKADDSSQETVWHTISKSLARECKIELNNISERESFLAFVETNLTVQKKLQKDINIVNSST